MLNRVAAGRGGVRYRGRQNVAFHPQLRSPARSELGPLFLTVPFDHADVLDPYTIRFVLKYPYAAWPVILWHPAVCSIVDPNAVEAHGGIQPGKRNDYLSANTAGVGAWTIDRWDQGQRIVLVGSPQYWRGWRAQHLHRVVLETVPEEETRLLRLKKGDIDMATDTRRACPGSRNESPRRPPIGGRMP